ncbi:MAG: Protein of unknown function CoA enzyme activase [Firmicutes bacterium]|nr:Protein of unknown function CoA enzyme activase [Bacillota bacterium]
MALTIGIPRGLLYYYYGEIWRRYFERLGVQVVVSGETTRSMIDQGGKIDEVCLPVKVYIGHACALKDKADFIFIPRIVSVAARQYNCPKIIGLPDLVRSNFPSLPPLLDTEINLRKGRYDLFRAVVELGKRIGNSPIASLTAWLKAVRSVKPVMTSSGGKVNGVQVGLIGHPYILNDSHISMDITGKLERLGVNVVGAGAINDKEIVKAAKQLSKEIFWHYCQHLAGAALALMKFPQPLDGVIFVTSFACGPDSLVGEVLSWHARQLNIPVLMLTMDEHTGEAGLVTRLEAFIDMLVRRKKLCC